MGFGVWGSGFGVSGFGVWSLGFRVSGSLGFRVWELRIDQVRLVEVAVVPLALVLV